MFNEAMQCREETRMKSFDRSACFAKLSAEFGDLLGGERWDSIIALRVIFYCEKNFGAVFRAKDLVRENFSSVEAVVSLLEGKAKGQV
jgi:acyl carrier protein